MPIQNSGLVSVTLTAEELEEARKLRRARENDGVYWPSTKWDYTEYEEFDHQIRNHFRIYDMSIRYIPITNYNEIFHD